MRLPGFVTRNLRLKGTAMVVATILWAGVAYASNPPDTRSVTVPVPQDSGSVAPFVLVHALPAMVIRVSGTRDHLNAFVPADLVVSVNYRSITRVGVQQLPVSVVTNDRDVVLDSPPTSVTADLDRLDSRSVPVIVDYGRNPPPQGYVVVNPTTTPTTVTVIGPHNQLASAQARVTVNLSNQKTNFQADEPVFLYDSRTGQRLNFGLSITVAGHPQATVLVTIEVAASLTSRASAVLPKVSGSVGAGHFLSGLSVSPATVVLTGPQDLLNTLDSVSTQTISDNGITGTLTFTVDLVPPAGVTASPARVTVTISVGTIPQPPPSPTATPTPTPTPVPTPTPTQ